MDKNFTIMETREMSKQRLEAEIGKCTKRIEKLGMNHVEACQFVSSIMNLGIAIQEKFDSEREIK